MQIAAIRASIVTNLWGTAVAPQVQQAQYLEHAAQALATALYTHFEESVVLARVYLTVPFDRLPPANQAFVRTLAGSAGAAATLQGTTPVLSLIGTHGQEGAWCDRRQSKGHVGIPLISSEFIGAIPMIARLLQELGLPLDWVDRRDTAVGLETLGSLTGLFFVADAAAATDNHGRKIIAAQDFVTTYKVKSVFGSGAIYLGQKELLVIVVFCRDAVPRVTAMSFLPLSSLFQSATIPLIRDKKIFAHG